MALELRPNCEFCASCVENELADVCPNCGGGFEKRPIRPATEWRPGLSLAQRPAASARHQLSYDHAEIAAFSAQLRGIPPHQR